jgi:hypothetical protein
VDREYKCLKAKPPGLANERHTPCKCWTWCIDLGNGLEVTTGIASVGVAARTKGSMLLDVGARCNSAHVNRM